MKLPLIVLCSIISTFLPFLACVTLLKHFSKQTKSVKFLWAFFAFAVISEIILLILNSQKIPSAWFHHIYTLIEYVLIIMIFTNWQTDSVVARLMRVSIPVYIFCFILLKIAGLENFEPGSYNNLTRPLAVLWLSAFAFLTLQALWRQSSANLISDYRFWALLAVVLYYTTSLILSAFMFTKNHSLLDALFKIHAVANILHNLLYTISVFRIRKAQQTALQ